MRELSTKGQRIERAQGTDQAISIWTRNFALLCVSNLCFFLSSQAFLPTLPLYLLKIGGAQRDVGYVMGMYTLSAMLMRAVAGVLSDRFGRKKIMMLGLVVVLAVALSYRFAKDVPFIEVLRVFHGLGFGLVATAIGTMVADNLPASRISEGIGYFGLTSTISMALSPMIALWLVDAFGYPVLFMVVGGLVFATLLCGLFVSGTPIRPRPAAGSTRFIASILEKNAILPSLLAFFLSLVNSAMLFFIALYAAALGVPHIGLFFAASSVCMAVSRPLAGRRADRGGTTIVLLFGLSILAAGVTTIALSHSISAFLVAGALAGFGLGCCVPTLQAMAVRRASPDRRGAATGTFFAAYDMGLGFGAILWGLIVQAAGYQLMFLVTLVPLAAAGAIYYRFREREGASAA